MNMNLDVVGAFFFGEVSRPNLGVERAKGFENLFILLNERARLDPFLISAREPTVLDKRRSFSLPLFVRGF